MRQIKGIEFANEYEKRAMTKAAIWAFILTMFTAFNVVSFIYFLFKWLDTLNIKVLAYTILLTVILASCASVRTYPTYSRKYQVKPKHYQIMKLKRLAQNPQLSA